MFDDLRAKSVSPFDEDAPEDDEFAAKTVVSKPVMARASQKKKHGSTEVPILGLTAGQRFVLAVMLFLNVAVLGCFLLLATQAIVLPSF